MSINLVTWNNFLGQSLLVFLVIEGLKIFPFISHAARGSIVYKMILNVAVNLVFVILVRGTGSEMFLGEGIGPIVLATLMGSLITIGLHRVKQAFERRSPSNHLWEAKHGSKA